MQTCFQHLLFPYECSTSSSYSSIILEHDFRVWKALCSNSQRYLLGKVPAFSNKYFVLFYSKICLYHVCRCIVLLALFSGCMLQCIFSFIILLFMQSVYCNAEKLNLQSLNEYKYLRQSTCHSISGVDDAEQFRVVTVFIFSL